MNMQLRKEQIETDDDIKETVDSLKDIIEEVKIIHERELNGKKIIEHNGVQAESVVGDARELLNSIRKGGMESLCLMEDQGKKKEAEEYRSRTFERYVGIRKLYDGYRDNV